MSRARFGRRGLGFHTLSGHIIPTRNLSTCWAVWKLPEPCPFVFLWKFSLYRLDGLNRPFIINLTSALLPFPEVVGWAESPNLLSCLGLSGYQPHPKVSYLDGQISQLINYKKALNTLKIVKILEVVCQVTGL
jgi:hypothetical protein